MNIDNLHDALGLLDDDLIEEVDMLRSKKKVVTYHRSKKQVLRYASIAACLLVCIVSIYAFGDSFLERLSGSKKSDTNESIREEYSDIVGGDMADEGEQDGVLPEDSNVKNEDQTTASGENTTEAREIKVEITGLTQDGFVGVIQEVDDANAFQTGTELTVILLKEELSGETTTVGTQHKDNEADEEFPIGSVLTVRFLQKNVVDTEDEKLTIYADEVIRD